MADATVKEVVKIQIRLDLGNNKVKSVSIGNVNPELSNADFEEVGQAMAELCAYPYKDVVRVETTTMTPQA
ncbi:MAG: hypothetical protein E7204_01970 [Veillonella sp.]|uniref:DUF1659 domain-containing protein n=1 Tax=Veillonella sp. TaxID=1926307 RepID=UPI0025DEBD50|nr:hypothetical protein [Veillonella sp.]MBE6079604.1 hypothetical protein [Veillonella sp.]